MSQLRRCRLSIVDRISALPDSPLHRILSFLPIKEVAATSILSKRWKQLWIGQLILNFNDQLFPNNLTFRSFVESVIADYYRDNNNISILQFHLKCRSNFSLTNASTNFILSCKTLVVLNLNNLVFDQDIIRYGVDLPSLKLLRLESITFTYYSYMIKILSGCPILEELETKDLTVKNNYRVHPDIPNTHVTGGLSKLIRANISGMHIMYDFLNNAEHLQLQVMFPYPIESMFHNLTHMEITFDTEPFDGNFKWSWLISLLQNFPKLQTLIIDEVDVVNNSGNGEWVDPKIVPECLLSRLTTCSLRNYSRINCELQFAKYIMQNSKVLNTMTIQVAKSVGYKVSNVDGVIFVANKFSHMSTFSYLKLIHGACMDRVVVRSLN